MRPGLFRIDEVRSQRRNPAPVVDSRVEQFIVVGRGKIGWRLQVDLRHEQAGDGDGAQHFAARGFRPVAASECLAWRGSSARSLPGCVRNAGGVRGWRAGCPRGLLGFADSDQQTGGEGNRLLSRFFDGAQAFGGNLVGRIVVGAAGAEQARRWWFQASDPCWERRRPGGRSTRRSAGRGWDGAAAWSRAEPVRTWIPDNAGSICNPGGADVARISGKASSGLSPRLNRASVQPIFSPARATSRTWSGVMV